MMSKEKDPVKETLKFIEDHAFFKPSAKLEMEAYLAKKEKKVQLQTAVKRIFEVKIKEASSVQQDASFLRLNIPVLTFSNCFGVTATG